MTHALPFGTRYPPDNPIADPAMPAYYPSTPRW